MATRITRRAAAHRVSSHHQTKKADPEKAAKKPGAGLHDASAADSAGKLEATRARLPAGIRPDRAALERVGPGFDAERMMPARPEAKTPGIEGTSLDGTATESKNEKADPLAELNELQPGRAGKRETPEELPDVPGRKPTKHDEKSKPGDLPGHDPRSEKDPTEGTEEGFWEGKNGRSLPKTSNQRAFEDSLKSESPVRPGRGVANEETKADGGGEGAKGESPQESSSSTGWWSTVVNFFSGGGKSAAGKVASGTAGTVASSGTTVLTTNLTPEGKRNETNALTALFQGGGMGSITDKGGGDRTIKKGSTRWEYANPEAEEPTGEAPDPLDKWHRRREEFARSDDYARFVSRVKAGRQAPVNPVPIDQRESLTSRGVERGMPGDDLPDPPPEMRAKRGVEGSPALSARDGLPGDDLPDPPPMTSTARVAGDAAAAEDVNPDVVFDPIRGPKGK